MWGWVAVVACSSPNKHTEMCEKSPKTEKIATVSLSETKIARGDHLRLKVKAIASLQHLELWYKDSLLLTTSEDTLSFSTQDIPVGQQQLRLRVLLSDSREETHYLRLQILAAAAARRYSYLLQARYPHDRKAYTQGLLLHENTLYESTGRRGYSYVQRRSWPEDEVLQTVHLPDDIFGEGIALKGDTLYQLSWQSHRGIMYDAKTLTKLGEFSYSTEGWGLTSWRHYLVMSDGSEHLYFYLTHPFRHSHTLQVYDHEAPVSGINELETVNDHIYANQYQVELLLIIDPRIGELLGKIDVSTLFDASAYERETGNEVDVLNGIAYDVQRGHLLLTGKLWPYMYEVLVASEPLP